MIMQNLVQFTYTWLFLFFTNFLLEIDENCFLVIFWILNFSDITCTYLRQFCFLWWFPDMYIHILIANSAEKVQIWSHLLKKSLIENFIFCVVKRMTFVKLPLLDQSLANATALQSVFLMLSILLSELNA